MISDRTISPQIENIHSNEDLVKETGIHGWFKKSQTIRACLQNASLLASRLFWRRLSW
jgi:hypothetical protein